MKISGHKTASVFRRYDITDEADLAEAAARLDEKRNAQTPELFWAEFGHDCTKIGRSRCYYRWHTSCASR
jgi:hypothetical protein